MEANMTHKLFSNTILTTVFLFFLLFFSLTAFSAAGPEGGPDEDEIIGATAPRATVVSGINPRSIRMVVSSDISNEGLDEEIGKFIQGQWYKDYKAASLRADEGEELENSFGTASSVFRRFLLPLVAVGGPTLGFIPDEETRTIVIGTAAAISAVFTVTAEWTEHEGERQADKKSSVDDFLTRIKEEIFKDPRVREKFSDLSDARIEASLTRVLVVDTIV